MLLLQIWPTAGAIPSCYVGREIKVPPPQWWIISSFRIKKEFRANGDEDIIEEIV